MFAANIGGEMTVDEFANVTNEQLDKLIADLELEISNMESEEIEAGEPYENAWKEKAAYGRLDYMFDDLKDRLGVLYGERQRRQEE